MKELTLTVIVMTFSFLFVYMMFLTAKRWNHHINDDEGLESRKVDTKFTLCFILNALLIASMFYVATGN